MTPPPGSGPVEEQQEAVSARLAAVEAERDELRKVLAKIEFALERVWPTPLGFASFVRRVLSSRVPASGDQP